jgi:hypothetical protein
MKTWAVKVYIRDSQDRDEEVISRLMEDFCNSIEHDISITADYDILRKKKK